MKLNCPFWTSTHTFLIIGLKPPSTTRTHIHNYLHFSSFHPEHCTRAIPHSQFLHLRRLCSKDDDFMRRSNEMLTFFSLPGYPRASLEKDLQRVRTIKCPDTLRPTELRVSTIDKVPLVLTYCTTLSTSKSNTFYFRTSAFYQTTSSPVISTHNCLS